jgi:hypothetical protein
MANIQKTLDSLQPYVIGIRYSQGLPLVDTVFKDGWTLPESQTIKKAKGNDELNYYMIYGETPSITIDGLLEYVALVIKLNQEKEKKQELLKLKFDEMKKLFRTLPLSKLQRLRFNFEDVIEDEISINDVDIAVDEDFQNPQPIEEKEEQQIVQPKTNIENTARLIDAEGNPEPITEEDIEFEEEEARAARNRELFQKRTPKVTTTKVELPPRRTQTISTEKNNTYSECECLEKEACDKCIDTKGFN